MTWPQPREGVTGIDRTDTLLSLDEEVMPARKLIVDLTMKLWRGCLVGSPPPILKERYEQMKSPYPGDLVIEQTRRDPLHGFGYLLVQREEWLHTNAEWDTTDRGGWDGERPTEYATYVQYGPAAIDVCRWVNAMFVALPRD